MKDLIFVEADVSGTRFFRYDLCSKTNEGEYYAALLSPHHSLDTV